jgi:3-oxoadipate enol-lactonase
VREKGVAALAGPNMERWFTKGFRERSSETIARMVEMFVATPLEGYVGCGEAVRDMDHRDLLPKIKAPTLVIIGKHDPATTPEAGEYIRSHIPGAAQVVLDAAHISNIEQSAAYSAAVVDFLTRRTT